MKQDRFQKAGIALLACAGAAGLFFMPGLTLTLALVCGICLGLRALWRKSETRPRLRKVLKGLGMILGALFALAAPGFVLPLALVCLAVRQLRKRLAGNGGPAGREEEPAPNGGSAGERAPAEGVYPGSRAAGRGKSTLQGVLVCLAAAGGLFLVKMLIACFVVAAGIAILFVSCTSEHGYPHNRWEVLRYVRETFPGERVAVSRDYSPPEGEEESKERVWQCWFEDLPEMPFTVTSYRWNGGPVPVWGYSLTDSAQSSAREYYMERYLGGGGSLDLWTMDYGHFEMEFSSMAEVRAAAEQLQTYYDWYVLQPHAGEPPNAWCTLSGLHLPTDMLLKDYVSVGLEDGRIQDAIEAGCGDILKRYYAFYQVPSPDFSQEEIAAYVEEYWEWEEFVPLDWRSKEWMRREDFRSVWEERGYVSYGGLYRMLEQVGASPEGTPERYAVTGADGCRYEFSYDFQTPDAGEIKWYYLKDGQEVLTDQSGRQNAPALYLKGDEVWGILVRGLRDQDKEKEPEEAGQEEEAPPAPDTEIRLEAPPGNGLFEDPLRLEPVTPEAAPAYSAMER